MICAEAKLKLEPCVSGTLSPEDRIALEEHLAICEGCRLELELTRAVMGAPPFEGADEPPASVPEPPAWAPEAPPPVPEQTQARAATSLFDEISFADLGSESPAPGSGPGAPPAAGGNAPGPGETDPFANFTTKPDEPAEASPATWDFEPAEVPRDSSPPEGSLSFANEALKRKRAAEEKQKAMLVRLALWGGGIGCGLVLLGVSVWIALAFRQDKSPDFPPNGGTPSVAPQPGTATQAPAQPTTTSGASDGGAAPPPATTQPTTAPTTQPTTAPTTQPTASAPTPGSEAPGSSVPTILDATPGVAPPPGPPPPDAGASTKSGSRVATGKPKPGSRAAAKPAAGLTARKGGSAGDDEEFPWKPVDDAPVARPASRRTGSQHAPSAAPGYAAPDAGAPRVGEPEAAPPPPPTPVNPPEATSPEQGTVPSEGAPAPSTGAAAPANPSPQPAGEPALKAPEPASTKPIDRLHVATETAAKNVDLVALRKLKSSWKSLVGSTAGPDRTRAKLEYADCLWSIQEISGRNSDRREALTAYRDYVLYAPAGGTNSRTVGRMRFLEDILTDK